MGTEWLPTLQGFIKTARSVLTNPLIIGILSGTLFSLTGLPLPVFVDQPVSMLGQVAAPLSLVVLGMGLAEYRISEGWQLSSAICFLKLIVQPMVVWLLAWSMDLPRWRPAWWYCWGQWPWGKRLPDVTPI